MPATSPDRRDRPNPVPTVFADLLAAYTVGGVQGWTYLDIKPVIMDLRTIWTTHRQLQPLVSRILAAESEYFLTTRPHPIPIDLSRKLVRTARLFAPLPDKPKFPPINTLEIDLLLHDTGSGLQEIVLDEDRLSPAYQRFLTADHTFTNFIFQLGVRKNHPGLRAAYSDLLRLYTRQEIIPTINKALAVPNPQGNFELLESRSAFRQIALLDPCKFATHFRLQEAIRQFITQRTFQDKRSGKPVVVSVTADSANPRVFMDIGDLYRMLRNLLRDAVTHGSGEVIRPVVQMSGERDLARLMIYSPGQLDEPTLAKIGRVPYSTQEGQHKHGYGKVGARKLLTDLWLAIGMPRPQVNRLLAHHWQNVNFQGKPHVRWTAPLPT